MLPAFTWLDQDLSSDCDVYDSGWRALIDQFLEEIDDALQGTSARLVLLQMKEKLGSLRVYWRLENSLPECKTIIEQHVSEAAEKSKITCVVCGRFGAIKAAGLGPVMPYCAVHSELDLRCLPFYSSYGGQP